MTRAGVLPVVFTLPLSCSCALMLQPRMMLLCPSAHTAQRKLLLCICCGPAVASVLTVRLDRRRSSSADELRKLSVEMDSEKGILVRLLRFSVDTISRDLADIDMVSACMPSPLRNVSFVDWCGLCLQIIANAFSPRMGPGSGAGTRPVTLLIEGSVIGSLLQYHHVALLKLLLSCGTVICCRATPAQKAELVTLVRSAGNVTLAIGDGGNDCAMILAANVGVGLSGREGLQAARAADYTFSQFRFLVPLCLVHGRYSLHRTAFIAQYCFYKSIFICLLQVLFNQMCLFSGCSFLDSFCLMTYHMVRGPLQRHAAAVSMVTLLWLVV